MKVTYQNIFVQLFYIDSSNRLNHTLYNSDMKVKVLMLPLLKLRAALIISRLVKNSMNRLYETKLTINAICLLTVPVDKLSYLQTLISNLLFFIYLLVSSRVRW